MICPFVQNLTVTTICTYSYDDEGKQKDFQEIQDQIQHPIECYNKQCSAFWRGKCRMKERR